MAAINALQTELRNGSNFTRIKLQAIMTESLLNIIRERDSKGLETWVNFWTDGKRQGLFNSDPAQEIASAANRLDSAFAYEEAIKYGYKLSPDDLSIASEKNNINNINFLLQIVPHDEKWLRRAFFQAIKYKRYEIVDILLEAGVTPNEADGIFVADRGDIDFFRKLHSHGLQPTTKIIESAINKYKMEMIDELLSIDPGLKFSFAPGTVSEQMALHFLKTAPTREQALEMLDSHDPRCPLILVLSPELTGMVCDYALEHNSLEAAKAIEHVPYRYATLYSYKMPTIAARTNSTDLAQKFDKYETKIEGYDYPIIEAVACKSRDVLKIFLSRRFLTDVVSIKGMTPVMLAVALNDAETLKILLEANAFLGSVDGHSPLSVAVAYNSLRCVRLILPLVVYDEDWTETNRGQRIFIDVQYATPGMKELLGLPL